MIHVISKHNAHLYPNVLRDMFQLRHKVFVEQRGWNKLAKADGLEKDQFDTDDTVYFLKLDEDFRIRGGMRLVPTTLPTQLGTIFKHYCVLKNPPMDVQRHEWSRYFITDTEYRSPAGYPVHYELFVAILEYCVHRGIEGVSGFIEAGILPRISKMPWEIEYLGPPVEYGGTDGEPVGLGAPLNIEVNKTMLRLTRIAWRVRKPVISLSLGEELTPAREFGFNADVQYQVEDFIRTCPEHVEAIGLFARELQHVDTGSRATVRGILETMTREVTMDGFDNKVSKTPNYVPTSLELQ